MIGEKISSNHTAGVQFTLREWRFFVYLVKWAVQLDFLAPGWVDLNELDSMIGQMNRSVIFGNEWLTDWSSVRTRKKGNGRGSISPGFLPKTAPVSFSSLAGGTENSNRLIRFLMNTSSRSTQSIGNRWHSDKTLGDLVMLIVSRESTTC